MNSTSQRDICIKSLEPVNITLFGEKKKVFLCVISSLRIFRGRENSGFSQVGPKCCSKYPYKADTGGGGSERRQSKKTEADSYVTISQRPAETNSY